MEKQEIKIKEQFEVRDTRDKGWYFTDDEFLNGYAKYIGIYAVGTYDSLCRHADKSQTSWPSIQKICDELDIGRNSVIEAIKRLEFWNIIKKVRIGKQCTNRYFLTKKTQWKTISEVCLKDYSEVCHTDFRGLRDKLQRFATQTSNRKETQKKGNTKERNLSANADVKDSSNWVKSILIWLEEKRKMKFADIGGQIGALGRLKKAGYKPKEIKDKLIAMEKEEFWQDKSPDFINLAKHIHKIKKLSSLIWK